MQVNETKTEGLKREFNIVVPWTEIEGNVSSRLEELAQTIQLPGFRPGKAPVSILRKKYGPSVMGEVLEKTVSNVTKETLKERNLRPAMQPEIEVVTFEDGSDLEFTMALEVMPEIEPLDMATLKLERLVAEPAESEIQTVLEGMAAGQKTSQPVKGARKSKKGDMLVIDFVGKVDGVEFPGGKAEDYSLELGSGSFIPGFEDQLTGAKTGDHVEVKVAFPKEYQAEDLAGKDAVFDVDVKEIRETAPAKIDDDLAKAVHKESLEDLKNSIREEHSKELKEQSRRRLKRTLLDVLADRYEFEAPEGMLNSELDTIWEQFDEQRKASPDKFDADSEKSDEEHKDELRPIAERRVRLALVLSNVSNENNINVSQEDINKGMMAQASKYPGQEQAIMEYFQKTPGALEGLSASIQEDKVVDFILEMATITDKKVSLEELMREPEDADSLKAKKKATVKPKKKVAAPKKAASKAKKKD